ncbi:LysM peptidoglycan-binding domain-containing protein [Nocardioides seonyuensis]|uniref:LysM peptidoglycan-binding domain-containing protein n=1 Tax=Nocardioides seonyuensis TaxID=2518371 RepID=A0A4V1BME2_9ACTN|nr:LysM peptidoglycan-binding domain-containing protein [Nocardioides seonyuensis]QBX56062.1 LysM peptidoglycan-binding domain-containing protein [Nocardioides seonyuensis]
MSTLSISPTFRTAAPRRSTVRLTRRGRVVVVLAGLLVALAAAFFLAAGAVGTEEAGTAPATEVVQVAPGDTLWGIASDVADDGDVRAMITEIERLNALDSAAVSAGQKLRVPVATD